MPIDRTAKATLAWRYPTRTPAAQTIRRPPTPGRASAASADSEAGARTALMVCSRNDSAPVGPTAAGASGAVPDSDKSWLNPATAIPPSMAGAGELPHDRAAAGAGMGELSGGVGNVGRARGNPAAAGRPAGALGPAPVPAAF